MSPLRGAQRARAADAVSAGRGAPRRLGCLVLALLAAATAPGARTAAATSPTATDRRVVADGRIATNRRFDVLPEGAGNGITGEAAERARLHAAARALGARSITLADASLDGDDLARWARAPEGEPLLRFVREDLGRALVIEDFLYFVDDVLRADRAGHRGEVVFVTPGRARKSGLLVHPDAVFAGRPRRYGSPEGWLDVTEPRPQAIHPAAEDFDPPGPGWTMRYRDPQGEAAMLDALRRERPRSDFADRLAQLMSQLRSAGARVQLDSTVRHPERGYLMWGAFELGRLEAARDVEAMCARLEARNRQWGLGVPIRWRHPQGWQATRDAARTMADTFDVVYATEAGARASSHYGGSAADLTAVALPRTLELQAPDGTRRRFDLSAPDQTRELSLTPELVDWVERAFGLEKLRPDYPHWDDARAR